MSPPIVKNFYKAPADILDYTANYTDELLKVRDFITSSEWLVPSHTNDSGGGDYVELADDVTVNYSQDAPAPVFSVAGCSNSTTMALIFIKGGTINKSYVVENRILTNGGRRYARRFTLTLVNKSERDA